jgi:hypothetical protein
MKKIIKRVSALLVLGTLVSCTHSKVEVSKITDSQMSCAQIEQELIDLKLIKQDIKNKRGISARNAGMFLLFWPGIFVNEINGNEAEKLVNARVEKLIGLHSQKGCQE